MVLLLLACATPLADHTPYVTAPRLLAVRSVPAEAEPGTAVTLETLYADDSGPLTEASITWSFCHATHPVAELGPVSETCLSADSADLLPLGSGLAPTGLLPDDGCSLFGPNPPPAEDGASAPRPTDPDVTGGFYQPLLSFENETLNTLASIRIRCGIANVNQETYAAWNSGYLNNENPEISEILLDGTPVSTEPLPVSAGTTVPITVSWPVCDEGCGGAERYLVWSPTEKLLKTRRESLSVTYFATGGSFEEARNGQAGESDESSVENHWTAPSDGGTIWLSAVLRDERGGVAFTGFWVEVQ